MAKYLTKAQVIADFKINYLPQIDEADRETTWGLLLKALHNDKRISDKQYVSWKYPKKELTS